ncbi:hypothetical protein BC829DRAFT_394660 [Chytridium lagenaria]|nr:hypothetical protein BC829DRAFT_394660 [Chytridium lagenaria]
MDKTKPCRVLLHVDLDAFYAQVEHVRLNIPIDVPLAVQQWQGLIAVNYAARAKGIKRHCTVEDAKAIAPDIRFVHVATFGPDSTEPGYHDDPKTATHKVSLDVYRRASAKIMEVMRRFVHERLTSLMADGKESDFSWDGAGHLYGDLTDSKIKKLGYTCSAGIAHNKTLAKLCSSLNKPNKQTILRDVEVLNFMKELPFNRLGVEKAGEIWNFSLDFLKAEFGEEKGRWIYNISRGICDEPVSEVARHKSIGANKNLRPPANSDNDLNKWIEMLSSEIFYRLQNELVENKRWPKNIGINCRTATGATFSRSCPMLPKEKITSHLNIAMLASLLLKGEKVFPCTGFGISVSGLSEVEDGLRKIDTFFQPKHLSAVQAQESISPANAENTSTSDNAVGMDIGPIVSSNLYCEPCKLSFSDESGAEEHRDFHFALDLQKEERQNYRSNMFDRDDGVRHQVKKPAMKGKAVKGQSCLQRFFQKKADNS